MFPDPGLEMSLNCGGDVADILRLIGGARDPELVHVDIETRAVADAQATADPDARADAPGDHRRDRHALGGIAEERYGHALRIIEVGDESEPAALAHIVHD